MIGILNTSKISKKIIDLLLENDEYFINVLEKFNKNFLKIPEDIQYSILDKNDDIRSILIYTKDGHYYPFISEEHINAASNILNDDFHNIFSIYSNENISKDLLSNIKYPSRLVVSYNVMRLLKEDFIPQNSELSDYYCRKCDEKDYKELKVLQYQYHKEEVYTDNSFYPHISEMQAFKRSLKQRINFTVFQKEDKEIPVSKASVNGESLNTYQLGGIFTKKKYRKKGLSQLCLTYLIKEVFKNENIKKIVLYVKKDNIPANRLYIKLGFKNIFQTTLSYF